MRVEKEWGERFEETAETGQAPDEFRQKVLAQVMCVSQARCSSAGLLLPWQVWEWELVTGVSVCA